MKRVVVVSDLHCGHILGLTPPEWDSRAEEEGTEYLSTAWRQRRYIWEFYAKTIRALQPIHLLICNGDAIDGSGERVAGREMLIADKTEQAKMASDCLKFARAKNIMMTYGTGYHTGKDVDFEKIIADKIGAKKIESVGHIQVNGVVFHVRHHVSSSQAPYSRGTAISRDRIWNVLWAARKEYPRADILIRSHAHYFTFCGDGTWLGLVTPGLQGYGSIYGARNMSGLVDIGLVHFDVADKGSDYVWDWSLCRMPLSNPTPV